MLVFALTFAALMALHAPLLRLPYFWDEAGYYVPAARDLLLSGSLIPHSTVSNAHPPLVMAYLALWWKVAGFTPVVTRTAMLLAASFALLGLFRLAQSVANSEVAIATTILTAIYPVFFAQSSLVHLDLVAAGFTFWGSVRLPERQRMGDGALVLARQSDQGDGDSGAAGACSRGMFSSRWLPDEEYKADRAFAAAGKIRSCFWFRFCLSPPGTPITTGAPVLFSAIRNSFDTTSRPQFILCGFCWRC